MGQPAGCAELDRSRPASTTPDSLMLTICPTCASPYLPGDSRHGHDAGCGRCSTPEGPGSSTASQPIEPRRCDRRPPFSSPSVTKREVTCTARPFRSRGPTIGTAALVAALVVTMGAIGMRKAIVGVAPAVAPLFDAIGLSVNLRGLDIRVVKSSILDDGDKRVLAVEGEIANMRETVVAVPALRLALRNDIGREIYTWTAPAPKARLGAGESVAFRTRLAAPPGSARDVAVRFATAETK
jgi:hypothetical protein